MKKRSQYFEAYGVFLGQNRNSRVSASISFWRYREESRNIWAKGLLRALYAITCFPQVIGSWGPEDAQTLPKRISQISARNVGLLRKESLHNEEACHQ